MRLRRVAAELAQRAALPQQVPALVELHLDGLQPLVLLGLVDVLVLKLVAQPTAAFLIGRYAVGLIGRDLLAVTVIAALPTAQNVFVFAMRYDRGVILARDTIFVATLLSVPVILAITWLLTS